MSTVTIPLTAEQEATLSTTAHKHGQDAEAFVATALNHLLRALAALQGIECKVEVSAANISISRRRPESICLNQPYAALASQIASKLEAHPDKLRNFDPMSPERFVTWLEAQGICTFHKTSGETTSLTLAQARILLESDAIRAITCAPHRLGEPILLTEEEAASMDWDALCR